MTRTPFVNVLSDVAVIVTVPVVVTVAHPIRSAASVVWTFCFDVYVNDPIAPVPAVLLNVGVFVFGSSPHAHTMMSPAVSDIEFDTIVKPDVHAFADPVLLAIATSAF